MSNIIVPEQVLENPDAFKQWFSAIYIEMFGDPLSIKLDKRAFPTDTLEAIGLLERIMEHVNFSINGVYKIPYYRTKGKKYTTGVSDIVAITAHIISEQFNITFVTLGKHIGVNHATIIYYRKKVDNMLFANKRFPAKYIRILINLQSQGIISTIRLTNPELRDLIKKYANQDIVLK
jgi:hypothetical protein